MKRKILFISKNYPPKIGGLESYSYNLIQEFEQHHHVIKIVLSKSNLNLIWFVPYSLLKSFYLARKNSFRHIHLCDAVLSPIGFFLKICLGAQVSVTVHGLDITYNNFFYKRLIPSCIARLDKIISVSQATRKECQRRKIPIQNCAVIPNGIRPNELYLSDPPDVLQAKLEKMTGRAIRKRKILLTLGRLVKRKGVAWFIDSVMPRLDSSYIYIIAGVGPEYDRIHRSVSSLNLENRVMMLGRVSNESRKILLNVADIFIMPNISVANDIEGFGIVALEAGSCGVPVVASNLQGLKDAVTDGQTGYLVEEGDVEGFLTVIRSMNLVKAHIRSYVINKFNWKNIYLDYRKVIFD